MGTPTICLNFRVEYTPPRNHDLLALLTYEYCDYPYMMEMTFTNEVWEWLRENGIRANLSVFENIDPWIMEPLIDVAVSFETHEAATLFKLTWIG